MNSILNWNDNLAATFEANHFDRNVVRFNIFTLIQKVMLWLMKTDAVFLKWGKSLRKWY